MAASSSRPWRTQIENMPLLYVAVHSLLSCLLPTDPAEPLWAPLPKNCENLYILAKNVEKISNFVSLLSKSSILSSNFNFFSCLGAPMLVALLCLWRPLRCLPGLPCYAGPGTPYLLPTLNYLNRSG